jgi:hypothetical protein
VSDDNPEYLVGDKGVQLTGTPLHTPDGGLLSAQNVEFIREFGLGGIGSRGGLARLNGVAGAGAIVHVQNLPFAYPNDLVLMVALNAGETNTWKKSTDGTTYTDLTSVELEKSVGTQKMSGATINPQLFFIPQRSASYKRRLYYAGDNYTFDVTAPVMVVFDGVIAFELFRLPPNPTQTGTVARWISEMMTANGLIYFCTFEAGGVAPDHKGRVISFDPENGTLVLIGNRFGNGTGENTGGMPYCLTAYLGSLWAGTMGVSGNPAGKVYRILPGVDSVWTLDHAGAADDGYYMSLLQFQGSLFAARSADTSGTPTIQKRTSAGVWTTSYPGTGVGQGYCGGLVEFDSLLFCAEYQSGTRALIKKFDGTTWTTDKDVGVDYAILSKAPGQPFVFNGALYWPWFEDSSDVNLTNFLLKRTTGGVWTKAIATAGIRGGLGMYRPDAS